MKIKFKDVGRNKESWEVECAVEPSYDFLYKQVRSKCISSDIDFATSEDNPNRGIILAGFHKIGSFEIEG